MNRKVILLLYGFIVFTVAFLFFYGSVFALTLTIEGPDSFTTNVSGWSKSGLWFEALQDITLESFMFNNQGQNDIIQLTDAEGVGAGNMLYSYNSPNGDMEHLANVSWDLAAGEDYCIISLKDNNGKYVDTSLGFCHPQENLHISTIGSTGNEAKWYGGWYSFTDITTTLSSSSAPVPEPSTWLLLGLGLIGLVGTMGLKKAI